MFSIPLEMPYSISLSFLLVQQYKSFLKLQSSRMVIIAIVLLLSLVFILKICLLQKYLIYFIPVEITMCGHHRMCCMKWQYSGRRRTYSPLHFGRDAKAICGQPLMRWDF